MTTTDTTREAPLATRHPWFLNLYAELLADPAAATPRIAARLASADISDPIESALTLYLAALSAQQEQQQTPGAPSTSPPHPAGRGQGWGSSFRSGFPPRTAHPIPPRRHLPPP